MRGRHRILLGAAAGVGKSYRMLQEGRQALDEGRDVVIAYLEPHERPETASLAEGLEVIPRRQVQLGDLVLQEMDVDAVIGRAPELALVDELAHTNAPGSKNAKRYEDIDEILEAGIDVISTVNVQHLESLNDAIFELTGVRVRETFPDGVLDQANEVVLVDLAPEALQERLKAGKVYPGHQVERALLNFFTLDNLGALRELALREVAEDVEQRREAVILDRLSQQAVAERVLALVTPDPRSQRLLRRAWRSAERLGAEMDALWIRRPDQELHDDEQVALAALRRLGGDPRRPLPGGGGRRSRRGRAARRARARDDVRLRRHARGEQGSRDPARVARLAADPSAAGRRHPHRGRPGASRGGARRETVDAFEAAGLRRPGQGRILVPFTSGELDSVVLDAALRIAQADEAMLVPAYLIVVPLKFSLEAALKNEVEIAMPFLEAVEVASLRASVPVDARIERGRTPSDALERLWEVEAFDRDRGTGAAPRPPRSQRRGSDVDPRARSLRDPDPASGTAARQKGLANPLGHRAARTRSLLR